MAIFGLMALAVAPALAAIGFLVAGRPRQALIWFAAALLCEAFLGGFFYLLGDMRIEFPSLITCLCLHVAGAGQFIAALRSPRAYAWSLPCAVAAVLVLVVVMPGLYLSRFPDWNSLPVLITSLVLAVGSLIIAILPKKIFQPIRGDLQDGA